MSERGSRSGCFKVGCFGCLGATALLAGLMLLVALLQFGRARSDHEMERRETVTELPRLAELERLRASGEIGSGETLTLGERSDARSFFEREGIAKKVGKVVLDLDVGEFEIEPADPGEELSLETHIEPDLYRLEEKLERNDDGSWTYRLVVRPRGGMLGMMFRGGGNNSDSGITLRLPRDRPFDLVGTVGLGSTSIDLGGLLVRNVDLKAKVGEHTIDFSEPLPVPMESFRVDKSIGELTISRLGNASPAEVSLDQSVGELSVGLRGPWAGDANLSIHNGVGEIGVDLPRDVRVDFEGSSVGLGERNIRVPREQDLPPDAPTLHLDLSGSVGEVRAD